MVASATGSRPVRWRELALSPLSGRAWLATAQVVLGLPLAVLTFVLVVVGLALSVGLLPLFLLGLPILVGVLELAHTLTRIERARLGLFLAAGIPDVGSPISRELPLTTRMRVRLRSRRSWREVAYLLLQLPVSVVAFSVVVATWSAAAALLSLLVLAPLSPAGAGVLGEVPLALLLAAGIALLYAAPWVAVSAAGLEATLARSLLGPGSQERLVARVTALQDTRARAVEAGDAERRRIERDLHDGAQQRLVALAMSLGRAKAKLATDPAGAAELVDEAHTEAKQALVELRDLARGIHPAVLTDRGLDAALSALAARSPVAVRVAVDLPGRQSPTIEAVAYFVVAEALTNIAKHARASAAGVLVDRHAGALRLRVTDDGVGGARADLGTGLTGLADRVAAVDGTLTLHSPAGGPTELTVELPCVS